MLCCGFVGRGVKYVVLPLVFSYFLLAISRDPGDREPSHLLRPFFDSLILRPAYDPINRSNLKPGFECEVQVNFESRSMQPQASFAT